MDCQRALEWLTEFDEKSAKIELRRVHGPIDRLKRRTIWRGRNAPKPAASHEVLRFAYNRKLEGEFG